jgi:hypothetical protein
MYARLKGAADSERVYVQVVSTSRSHVDGRVFQHVIATLGRVDDLDDLQRQEVLTHLNAGLKGVQPTRRARAAERPADA